MRTRSRYLLAVPGALLALVAAAVGWGWWQLRGSLPQLDGPHTLAGLGACYMAGVPFYRNDLLSTTVVCGLAFGVPVLVRRMNAARTQVALAGK